MATGKISAAAKLLSAMVSELRKASPSKETLQRSLEAFLVTLMDSTPIKGTLTKILNSVDTFKGKGNQVTPTERQTLLQLIVSKTEETHPWFAVLCNYADDLQVARDADQKQPVVEKNPELPGVSLDADGGSAHQETPDQGDSGQKDGNGLEEEDGVEEIEIVEDEFQDVEEIPTIQATQVSQENRRNPGNAARAFVQRKVSQPTEAGALNGDPSDSPHDSPHDSEGDDSSHSDDEREVNKSKGMKAQRPLGGTPSSKTTSSRRKASNLPRIPKKKAPEYKEEKETFLAFSSVFIQQMETLGVLVESETFREYFEHAIQDTTKTKQKYWQIVKRHKSWDMRKTLRWMTRLLDGLQEEETISAFSSLKQGINESVSVFYDRFMKELLKYSVFVNVSARKEERLFREKLRTSTQKDLNKLRRLGLLSGDIEDTFIEAIDIEEKAGVKQKGVFMIEQDETETTMLEEKEEKLDLETEVKQVLVNMGYKDRTKKGKPKRKFVKSYPQKCWICGDNNHLLKACPFNTFQRQPPASNAGIPRLANTVMEEKSVCNPLPLFDTFATNPVDSDDFETCRVLLDTGSQITLIANSLVEKLKLDVVPSAVNFGGVASSGTSQGLATLQLLLGSQGWKSFDAHIVDMPSGMDMILGLDSNLTSVNVSTRKAEIGTIKFSFQLHQEGNVDKVLKTHEEIFAVENWSSTSKLPPVKIKLRPGSSPVKCPIIPQSEADEEALESEIQEMVRKGIVKPVSSSKWCFPFFMAKKSNSDKKRSAVDFRQLNPLLEFVPVNFPTAEEILDAIPHGSRVFSTIDLNKAYHQLTVIDEEECLVIRSRSGMYRFQVLPLGLASAVALFQNVIETLLGEDLLRCGAKVYLDDILLYSDNMENHAKLLDRVLTALKEAGLKVKKSKCIFAAPEVKFLGYLVSSEGIALEESRLQGLIQTPTPKTPSDVRGFMGGLVMLRKFSPLIAEVTRPLNSLTGKLPSEFRWEQMHEDAFNKVKSLLQSLLKSARICRHDPELPLILETDASNMALGASLIQEERVNCDEERQSEDDVGRPSKRLIAAVSRTLNSAELNYSTLRRELLSIVFAVEKFRKFLVGRRFIIRCDHKPISGLMRKPIHTLPERLRDLVERLLEFDFELEYIPGVQNVFPDFLSRNCIDSLYEYASFRQTQGHFEVLVKGKWMKWIRPEERTQLLSATHGSLHRGYSKMLEELSAANVTWNSLQVDVRDFLGGCLCAVTKTNKRRVGWSQTIPADLALDLYTFKQTYLTILNMSSDEVFALKVDNKSSEEINQVFLGWLESMSIDPTSLIVLTDRGTEFTEFWSFVKQHVKTASFSPSANGKLERRHREISSLCRLYDILPPEACEILNRGRMVNTTTKLLPSPGELVLRFVQRMGTSKTEDPWSGPYLVQECIGSRMVRALNLETMRESHIHLSDLKIYRRPATSSWQLNPAILQDLSTELDVKFEDLLNVSMESVGSWKGKTVFIDISSAADLEDVFCKSLKELPNNLLVVIPEWKERDFWRMHEGILGDQVLIPGDADSFLIKGEPVGFRIWNCWLGIFKRKALESASSQGLASVKYDLGELLKFRGMNEDHPVTEA